MVARPHDLVVLAAGVQTETFLEAIGISLGMHRSPVVLLRYRARKMLLANILSFPESEVSQAVDGTVLVVEEVHAGCDEHDFRNPRQRAGFALSDYLAMAGDFAFEGGAIGQRPVFPDGLPRRGFVKSARGLYCLVGHPGVILAPLLGRLAAEELVSVSLIA